MERVAPAATVIVAAAATTAAVTAGYVDVGLTAPRQPLLLVPLDVARQQRTILPERGRRVNYVEKKGQAGMDAPRGRGQAGQRTGGGGAARSTAACP